MASGIHYTHVIAWENLGLQYTLGKAWANYAQDRDIICFVKGVEELRTSYKCLPGMGGKKELWLKSPFFGPTQITRDGGMLTLALYTQSRGESCPLIHGFNLNQGGPTVERWAEHNGLNGQQWWPDFIQQTGINIGDKFIDVWPEIARLSSTWVRGRWNMNQVSPNSSGGLRIWKYTDFNKKVECDPEERIEVLRRCTLWANE